MNLNHVSQAELKTLKKGEKLGRLKGIPGNKKTFRDKYTNILVRYFICNDCRNEHRHYGAGGLPPRCASCAGGRTGELTGWRYMEAREQRQARKREGK